MATSHDLIDTPVGTLTLVATRSGLAAVLWEVEREGRVAIDHGPRDGANPILAAASRQLREYFAGTRTAFDLPLDPLGTDFQCEVWQALRAIPHGETRSYGEIARAIGRPDAVRAVGAANGRNPLSIVVPCHRVVGGTGALTGFAGGMAAKRWLLDMERHAAEPALPLHAAPQTVRAEA